jgi:hypothetical protein
MYEIRFLTVDTKLGNRAYLSGLEEHIITAVRDHLQYFPLAKFAVKETLGQGGMMLPHGKQSIFNSVTHVSV